MKYFILIFLFFINGLSYAQNLVPNPSFEEYSSCPTNTFPPEIEVAVGWKRYSGNNPVSTPDYYNSCAPSDEYGVPQSFFLYQTDNRDCNGYMGLITWEQNPNMREHIGIELTQPLVVGQKYFLSFYTVAGGMRFEEEFYEASTNNIGMRLSTIEYTPANPIPIDNLAHLYSENIITDTVKWQIISGAFVADLEYRYLILGNFFDDDHTDILTHTCDGCMNYYGYYLIDDICISTDSLLCNGGMLKLPCTVSINETIPNSFSIFPNPAKDFITIQGLINEPFELCITNALGQQLYFEKNIVFDKKQIDISNYQNGLLIISLQTPKKQFHYKLLKQ